jgi:hypothetical protein
MNLHEGRLRFLKRALRWTRVGIGSDTPVRPLAKGVALVSLDKALGRLSGDRATEHMVREILQMLRVRPGEPASAADLARRLERPEASVAVVLLELADAYVLRRDGLRYCYERDFALELDVDRFLTRAESHNATGRANVAKFRDRLGYR